MIWKLQLIAVPCLVLSMLNVGFASEVSDVMKKQRAQVQAERKALVGGTMQLSSEQNEKFWALYDKYADERRKNDDRMQKIILEYAKYYPHVPDKIAGELMDDWLEVETQDLKLKKKYVSRFKSILTPQQLVRYFQTENKLDSIVNSRMTAKIPLMEQK